VLTMAAGALVAVGLHGVLALGSPLRQVMAANILGSGVFILLIALSRDAEGRVDPVPQAMVLTGIVVSFAATALALSLVRSLTSEPESDEQAD